MVKDMTVGDVIRQYRIEHDMSLAEFGRRAGLTRGYLSAVERGVNSNGSPARLSYASAQRIAKVMGITHSDLIKAIEGSDDIILTEKEKRLIKAYRSDNDVVREYVDKLLHLK